MNQDPLGLQAYVVQHEGAGYVQVKDIEQKRGKVRAVALYIPQTKFVHSLYRFRFWNWEEKLQYTI